MVFMVIVSIMALFAVMVVFRDVIQEVLAARRVRDDESKAMMQEALRIIDEASAKEAAAVEAAAQAAAAAEAAAQAAQATAEATKEPVVIIEAPVEEPAPVVIVEEPKEEPVIEEAPVEIIDESGKISFSTGQQQTLDEKYFALTPEQRSWYDEIIKYASAVEDSKRFKNLRYEEYKVGKNRLVRVLIKRGVINCEFNLQNADFKNYVNENKISVKQSATTILVETAETVAAVKSSIDIVVAAIAEEREYKKKLAREKRRAREAAAK